MPIRALKCKYPQFYNTSAIDVVAEYKTEMRHVEPQAGRKVQFCVGDPKRDTLKAWN